MVDVEAFKEGESCSRIIHQKLQGDYFFGRKSKTNCCSFGLDTPLNQLHTCTVQSFHFLQVI